MKIKELSDIIQERFGEVLIKPDELWEGKIHFRVEDYTFIKQNFGQIDGITYYPGCGRDFAPIYAFKSPNLVYQDIGHFGFERKIDEEYMDLFSKLAQKDLIKNLKIKKPLFKRGVLIFEFSAADLEDNKYWSKKLELFYGEDKGDMCKYAPKHASYADLVYLEGMHLYSSMLPNFKIGTLIRSSTTIDSPWYFDIPEGINPEMLGLKTLNLEKGIFRKTKHIRLYEIRKLQKYIENLEGILYKLLSQGASDVDTLCKRSGIESNLVLGLLSSLEKQGRIVKTDLNYIKP